jgi:hypothetical protein
MADSLAEAAACDRGLLELQAHELALVHRFAVYLVSRLKGDLLRYALTVDLDYDRRGHRQKFLPPRLDRHKSDPSRFRPDGVAPGWTSWRGNRSSTRDFAMPAAMCPPPVPAAGDNVVTHEAERLRYSQDEMDY